MDDQAGGEHRIMTVLEARVAPENWERLKQLYQASGDRLPRQMIQTFLVQSQEDPSLWRGISVWQSREALEAYRRSAETPAGVLIFRSAGSEPTVALYDVAAMLAV